MKTPLTSEEYFKNLRRNITQVGWSVVAIGPGETTPGFAYTVGLALKGKPDLITFGLPPDVAISLLNAEAKKLVAGQEVANIPIPLPNNNKAMLIDAPSDVAAQYALSAVRIAQEAGVAASFLQYVWSDTRGRLPWEAGFETRFLAAQPLLRAYANLS